MARNLAPAFGSPTMVPGWVRLVAFGSPRPHLHSPLAKHSCEALSSCEALLRSTLLLRGCEASMPFHPLELRENKIQRNVMQTTTATASITTRTTTRENQSPDAVVQGSAPPPWLNPTPIYSPHSI